MSATQTTRPAIATSLSTPATPAGSAILSGHMAHEPHCYIAAEGDHSPQARSSSESSIPSLAGTQASHGHSPAVIQRTGAVADHVPGGHGGIDTQGTSAAGGSCPGQPATMPSAIPTRPALLADPLLALAADILGDLETVRIANENRLRQLTRSAEDKDGETRGFGLDEAHPDVARLAALVDMLAKAEHQAVLNLGRVMRRHPLGPWVTGTIGIGVKQGARLIAAIGDPYIRPAIAREDGTVEPSRPRLVSELWAYAGYHVIDIPAGSHVVLGSQFRDAAGGEQNGSHPGHDLHGTLATAAGVAAKRARGQRANWSATAKMRAYLVAESCMKNRSSPYRAVYDATRAKYADAVHQVPCVRCGPSGKPAQPGSPLSDGHKHARALRAVAKEVLRDLWREAKRIHETPVSGQKRPDAHAMSAADGPALPGGQAHVDNHAAPAAGTNTNGGTSNA